MGRTKINQSVDMITTEDNVSETMEETLPMTGRAVGTAIDPMTGTWVAAVIEFNPSTGQARVSRTLPSGNSKMEAAEKFKILAVEEGVVV
jgi:hypothetical protein